LALEIPTNCVNLCVPPAPGITPNEVSGRPKIAFLPKFFYVPTLKSHAMASSKPPPKAIPSIEAIVGFSKFSCYLV